MTQRDRDAQAWEVARLLWQAQAVAIQPDRPFRYASGIFSPIYCDLRLLMAYPSQRARIADLLVQRMREVGTLDTLDVVAGVASSGIPWAAWVAERCGKPMVYVREAPKDHGKQRLVEGKLSAGQRVVVVEDLVSTGASSLSTAGAVRAMGAVPYQCFSVFTYGLARASLAFRESGLELFALSDISTLLGVAAREGGLSSAGERAVRDWLRDQETVA
ncbi:MAG: orotate phosphoribosyltransferase [Chloroflexi bacterium]|nr:orotate phosphoribosyltransferase [Chloroflexota bacterium]